METKQNIDARDVGSPVRGLLMFRWNKLSSHLIGALQCMGMSHNEHCNGPIPEVVIHFGEMEMKIHATLLAALSSSWRKHLHAVMHQDGQIMHHIIVDIHVRPELLSTLKSLIYCGSAKSSVSLSEVMNVARALDLDYTEFLLSCNSNDLHTICWEGYQDRLTETFQFMCAHQLCTDVSILVDGHIIKAHKLILSVYSSVLKDTFQESRWIGTIHLPNIGVMNAQSLISYMYYGEALVMEMYITAFHKLCSSLEVMNLKETTKVFVQEEYEASNKEEGEYLNIQAQITPSLRSVWGRLCQLYRGERKTDLTFLVEKKRLPANKALISVASPVIYDMLSQELTHEHSLILITDMNYESIRGLLDIIYNGSCTLANDSRAVVCSYFDSSLFDIESSENHFQKECANNHTHRDKKSESCIKFLMEQGQKAAERTRIRCTPGKYKYPQAVAGTALAKAHESTEIQTGDYLEGQKKVMHHWNESMSEAVQSSRNPHDEASTSHSLEKHNAKLTGSSGRGLRADSCCKCKFEFSSMLHNEHADTHKSNEHLECLSCTDESVSDGVIPEVGSRPPLKKESYSCINCEKVFLSQTSQKAYSLQDHCADDLRRSCRQCCKKFERTDFGEDISTHTGDCPYNDKLCEKSFSHEGFMQQHLKTHQKKPKLLRCELCGKSYSHKALLIHMKVHKRKHKCPQCMKRFSEKNLLDDHIKMNHRGLVQHINKCVKCSMSFRSSSQLRNHILQVHVARGGVEYACKQCHLTYKTERLLQVHMQSHGVKVKPYKCSSCSSDFHHHQSLMIHAQKMHTLEMPSSCSGCDKQFSRSDTMKKHEQNCHQRQSQLGSLEGVTEEMNSQPAPTTGSPYTQCGQNLSGVEAVEQHNKMPHNSTTMVLKEKKKAGMKEIREDITNQSVRESCSCPDCGEIFPDIASLSAHASAQNHAGVDKSCWVCGLCGGAFLEEDQLNRHMFTHEQHFGNCLVSPSTVKHRKKECFSVSANNYQFNEDLEGRQKFLVSAHGLSEKNEMGERETVGGNAHQTDVSSLLLDSGNLIDQFKVNASGLANDSRLNVASTVGSRVISASNVAQRNVTESVTEMNTVTIQKEIQQNSHIPTSSTIVGNLPMNYLCTRTPGTLETSSIGNQHCQEGSLSGVISDAWDAGTLLDMISSSVPN
ncbi:uncharacterized protein [Panulirus ornatus]|uniref:uncharacterized protein isoform X2 n=1 Tax=Panulirus ornatus TaxID=150431 RepID=UPI003A85AD4B